MDIKKIGVLAVIMCLILASGCVNNERELFKENLDKGEKYLYSLEYERSFEYLESANQIYKKGFKPAAKDKAKMFACLSAIYIWKKDIEQALSFAKNAWEVEGEGKAYGYLYGRLLFAVDKEVQALEVFDESFLLFPDRADEFSQKTYEHLKNKYRGQGKDNEG